jgi:hypothetical protein
MKIILSLAVLTLLFFGCKKTIREAQEDFVVNAMTNGQWMVKSYLKGSTDVTSSFSSYKFQFKENRTVDAIKDNITEKTGTWDANAADMSITANYSTQIEPLSLLNGTWVIVKNSLSYVEASMTIGNETRFLRLEKI